MHNLPHLAKTTSTKAMAMPSHRSHRRSAAPLPLWLTPLPSPRDDSSSSLRRLVATFFMSRCDRRHKLCTRQTEIADLVALSLPGAIQSLCQQKLFLTAATWNWQQYLGRYQRYPVSYSQRRLIGPDYKYIS